MHNDQTSVLRYREADLGSMSPEKMIVALYERIFRDLEDARAGFAAGDRPAANRAVTHAQAIISELRGALDHEIGGEIAANLDALYDFTFQELLEVLVDRDPVHLRNCERVLTPLLDSWRRVPAGAGDETLRAREADGCESGPEPAAPVGNGPTADGRRNALPPGGENRLSIRV